MSQTEYTSISVREEDKQVFEQTLDAIAKELGEEPTHSDALREISESYIGNQPLGEWKNND